MRAAGDAGDGDAEFAGVALRGSSQGAAEALAAASLGLPGMPVIDLDRAVSKGSPERTLQDLFAAVALQGQLPFRDASQDWVGHEAPDFILGAARGGNKLSKVHIWVGASILSRQLAEQAPNCNRTTSLEARIRKSV